MAAGFELLGISRARHDRRLYLAQSLEGHEWVPEEGVGLFTLLIAVDADRHSEEALVALAERLRESGLAYLCAWGPGCERVHDLFDRVRDAEGESGRPFLMTTWHENDSLAEAVHFAVNLSVAEMETAEELASVVAVSDRVEWQSALRELLLDETAANPA